MEGKLGLKWLLLGVISAVLAAVWMPVAAAAAETGVVEIPVSVLAEGTEPDWNAVYTVELMPETSDSPMPEGSRDGCYRMAVKGGSTGMIRLNCQEPGEYHYTLRQIPGKEENCAYDDRVFSLRLRVFEETVTADVLDPEGKPVTDILFRNRWAEPAWVTFSAWVTLDSLPPEDSTFSCLLLSEDGERVAEIRNQGRYVVFPALRFGKEGIFRYMIKAVAETDKGIVYDRAVYTVTVTVHRAEDYIAEVTCIRNGEAYAGTPCFAHYTEGSIPKTGDRIGLWVTVLLLSGASLLGLITLKRKMVI